MEERYLKNPLVEKNIRKVVSKKIHLFANNHDIDRESLYSDLLGEVANSPYNPLKSAPGSFACQVASKRVLDILDKKKRQARNEGLHVEMGEFRRGGQCDDKTPEEITIDIFTSVNQMFMAGGIPPRLPHCGTRYMDQVQRITLYILQQRMGWSSREAEQAMKDHPGILFAVSATQPPSREFFLRGRKAATQLQKNIEDQKRALLPSPE